MEKVENSTFGRAHKVANIEYKLDINNTSKVHVSYNNQCN